MIDLESFFGVLNIKSFTQDDDNKKGADFMVSIVVKYRGSSN